MTLKKQPVILSGLILFLNLVYLGYFFVAHPNNTPQMKYSEFGNEVLLQIVSYHLLLSAFRHNYKSESGVNDSMETVASLMYDNVLGWSMIGWIVFLQVVNLVAIVGNFVKEIYWKWHLKNLKKKKESITKVV